MDQIITEIKKEKKKFQIDDKKIFLVLGILIGINILIMLFLLMADLSLRSNFTSSQENVLQVKKNELLSEVNTMKSMTVCEDDTEEVQGEYIDVTVTFYDEYKTPITIPSICSDCTIREAGIVSNSSVSSIKGFKYLVVTKEIEDEFSGEMYTDISRILTNSNYTEIYLFDQEVISVLNKDVKYNIKYIPVMGNSTDVEGTEMNKVFKSDKGLYFIPRYITKKTVEESPDIKLEEFDTIKGGIIYVDSEEQNRFYIINKELFLVTLNYEPAISANLEYDQPLPITWEGDIENTYKYDYGYDACSADPGLRETEVSKDELKITGYRDGTEEPIYEYKDVNHTDIKKIYDQDYLPMSDYFEQEYGEKVLTYEEFVAQHPIIFWEDSRGVFIEFYNSDFVITGGCAKPIVYLYPQQQTDVSVKVLPTTGYLTFTYPQYNDIWNVTANSNGVLTDSKGDTYEYLWWESKSDFLPIKTDGFIVSSNNLDTFFDLTLGKAGFTQKEINDFKEYWIPTMNTEYTPYFRISFLQNEEVNSIAKLLITPTPNTEIRIFMIYDRLDSYIQIETQEIKHTPRKGFVVTEWGGTRR